jgi:hypothetical protein
MSPGGFPAISPELGVERRTAMPAARQRLQVTRVQRLRLGVDDDRISYRLKTGRLH